MCSPKWIYCGLCVIFFAIILSRAQGSHLMRASKEYEQVIDKQLDNADSDHARKKRWDYTADGCHCSGYTIECLQDAYCRWKQNSSLWTCQKQCCGLKCAIAGG